jgi:hypothetical protein
VVRGFNPDLKIDVIETQSNGASKCEFVFHEANLTLKNYLSIAYKKAVHPGKKAIMPWEYHVGHLLTTMEKVIEGELGETGQSAFQIALNEFAQVYGEQALQAVLGKREKDYADLPKT